MWVASVPYWGVKLMAVLIEARDLRKRFGVINAVDGISLEVEQGEVLGFSAPTAPASRRP